MFNVAQLQKQAARMQQQMEQVQALNQGKEISNTEMAKVTAGMKLPGFG
jgi:DNA-binding protein YbaB